MSTTDTNKVHLSGKYLLIPLEAYNFIGRSKRIVFREKKSEKCPDHHWLHKGTVFNRLGSPHAVFVDTDESYARYCIFGSRFKSTKYHLINYTSLYLIPCDATGESTSRQKSWADIKEYHEHLLIKNQDSSAVQCSKWLANILIGHKIESVLELGCGSGRNLFFIKEANPQVTVLGIDINEFAVKRAREQIADSQNIKVQSIYELDDFADDSVDAAFTSGVLMHVPKDKIEYVIRQMHRISKKYVYHFELHGPEHNFDYHRYPRDYLSLYKKLNLNLSTLTYNVYPQGDFRSDLSSYEHALLCSIKMDKTGTAHDGR